MLLNTGLNQTCINIPTASNLESALVSVDLIFISIYQTLIYLIFP